jgi:uncharacterized protein (DUF736 family)
MLNAVGNVIKQTDGRYNGTLRTASIKADIDTLPNMQKTADTKSNFRMMT